MSAQSELISTLKQQGIHHPKVLKALRSVPREAFVLPSLQKRAYANVALAIDCAQTISQPYIVALMTQALLKHPHANKVLEIGTGSGYQTAILASVFKEVWTIERIPALYEQAKSRLEALNFTNVHCKVDDGSQGWSEMAPFDAIMVTAASSCVPPALLEQLSDKEGLMVIPVGKQDEGQDLILLEKTGAHVQTTVLERVSFVPLIRSGYNMQ